MSTPEVPDVEDLIPEAWCIIANAFRGDWDSAPEDWRQAASLWREKYVKWCNAARVVRPVDFFASSKDPEAL